MPCGWLLLPKVCVLAGFLVFSKEKPKNQPHDQLNLHFFFEKMKIQFNCCWQATAFLPKN
jgi:hypothetical protein